MIGILRMVLEFNDVYEVLVFVGGGLGFVLPPVSCCVIKVFLFMFDTPF
jgi:hypothetical protein